MFKTLIAAALLATTASAHEFTLPSGDHIRCVDAERSAPAPPSSDDRGDSALRRRFGMDDTRDDDGNVRRCPANTIPMRATSSTTAQSSSAPHEWAAAYSYVENRGGRAVFNVWNPFVETPGEFSLAQLWLVGATNKGQQSLEAGWHVFPSLYGDNRTRLFIYASVAGVPGGCYNLDCGRFVQTSSAAILGGPLACTSTDGGAQCEVALEYARSDAGDWWLRVDGTWIGYYPAALFDPAGLGRSAAAVEAGGEIVNAAAPGTHTATSMGSGRPPSDGYGHAAYVRDIQYLDMGNNYRDVPSLGTTSPNNYPGVVVNGTTIFYGGPGRPRSETKLVAASPSSSALPAPSTLSIAFTIEATLADDVIVGAALQSPTSEVAIAADDRRVAVTPGNNVAVRSFDVPAATAPGTYDLTANLWRDRNRNGIIDAGDEVLGTITLPGAITVAPSRRRAAR